MKKIASIIMVLLFISTTLLACRSRLSFDAQYLRTNYDSNKSATAGLPFVISSRAELIRYCEIAWPNQSAAGRNAALSSNSFLESIGKYSDDFFKSKYLVIVIFQEISGSIRHEVKRVDKNGVISIDRLVPGEGRAMTADMAEWHVVIELDNKNKFEKASAKINDRTAP